MNRDLRRILRLWELGLARGFPPIGTVLEETERRFERCE
jgi:hypothetical protein